MVAWSVYATVQCALNLFAQRSVDGALTVFAFDLLLAAGWMLLTPAIWAFTEFGGFAWRSTAARIASHVVALTVVMVIEAAWRRYLIVALGASLGVPFFTTVLYYADLTMAAYLVIVIVGYALAADDALVRESRRLLTLRGQVARAQLAYLEAQLQPHFLFNSLGTISELAHEAPAAAARMLQQLASLLRFALEGRGECVGVIDEMAALEPYLDIQRVRFADWLSIETHIGVEALDIQIPRLTLQPLVENALRHGLVGRTSRGVIRIEARVEGNRLVLAIADNGVGLDRAAGAGGYGLGLANIRERLGTVYGEDCSLALRAGVAGGTVAEIRIPVQWPVRAAAAAAEDGAVTLPAAPNALVEFARQHAVSATICAWLVWGTLWMQQSIAFLSLRHRFDVASLPRLLVEHLVAILMWALLTPIVFRIAHAIPMSGPRRWRGLPLHVVLACTFALLHVGAWQLLTQGLVPLWSASYVTTMLWTVLLYALLVALAHYEQVSASRRDRATVAARLDAELQEARFDAAALRFKPEQTLATLEQLARTVHVDPRGSERAIARFADQVRGALDARVVRARPV